MTRSVIYDAASVQLLFPRRSSVLPRMLPTRRGGTHIPSPGIPGSRDISLMIHCWSTVEFLNIQIASLVGNMTPHWALLAGLGKQQPLSLARVQNSPEQAVFWCDSSQTRLSNNTSFRLVMNHPLVVNHPNVAGLYSFVKFRRLLCHQCESD